LEPGWLGILDRGQAVTVAWGQIVKDRALSSR
jgi:hypothetical protein